MRVHEMKPEEKRAATTLLEPLAGVGHNYVRGWKTTHLVQRPGRTCCNFFTVAKMKFIVHRPESNLVAQPPQQLVCTTADPAIVLPTVLIIFNVRILQKIAEDIEPRGISKTPGKVRITGNEGGSYIADLIQGGSDCRFVGRQANDMSAHAERMARGHNCRKGIVSGSPSNNRVI